MPARKLKIKCPKCSEGIDIADSDEEKIFIKCDSCGAKGHVRNPNRGTYEGMKTGSQSELKNEDEIKAPIEEEETEEPNSIDCPQCGEDIAVPYSTNERVRIKCNSCGAKGEISNPYVEDADDQETESSIEVEVELLECPKCESEIEVPYAKDERVVVECKSCGAMGKINNPHLLRQELEADDELEVDHEHEIGLESAGAQGLLETISCPKCKEDIDVPKSDEAKLKIKCLSCGAKGQISNPYL